MSSTVSVYNQDFSASLHGLYDNLSEQEREKKIINILAEILRKKALSKSDARENTNGLQPKDKKD